MTASPSRSAWSRAVLPGAAAVMEWLPPGRHLPDAGLFLGVWARPGGKCRETAGKCRGISENCGRISENCGKIRASFPIPHIIFPKSPTHPTPLRENPCPYWQRPLRIFQQVPAAHPRMRRRDCAVFNELRLFCGKMKDVGKLFCEYCAGFPPKSLTMVYFCSRFRRVAPSPWTGIPGNCLKQT